MTRIALVLAATLSLTGAGPRAQGAGAVRPGDVLRVELTSGVTTATAQAGGAVEAVLLEHRFGGTLPRGTRIGGVVESVRRAERGRVTAELRLRFTEVGTPTPLRISATVLVIDGRRFEINKDAIGVRTTSWAPEEELILGPPLGAGVGLMVGRKGAAAVLGALVGFSVLYLRERVGTTHDQYREVNLESGQRLSLHVR